MSGSLSSLALLGSLPTRERGLKALTLLSFLGLFVSLPTRERGLKAGGKFLLSSELNRRSLRGSVD